MYSNPALVESIPHHGDALTVAYLKQVALEVGLSLLRGGADTWPYS
jgi:hypothetical protein